MKECQQRKLETIHKTNYPGGGVRKKGGYRGLSRPMFVAVYNKGKFYFLLSSVRFRPTSHITYILRTHFLSCVT